MPRLANAANNRQIHDPQAATPAAQRLLRTLVVWMLVLALMSQSPTLYAQTSQSDSGWLSRLVQPNTAVGRRSKPMVGRQPMGPAIHSTIAGSPSSLELRAVARGDQARA